MDSVQLKLRDDFIEACGGATHLQLLLDGSIISVSADMRGLRIMVHAEAAKVRIDSGAWEEVPQQLH